MLKFSNFRLMSKKRVETEDTDRFTLVFEDVQYSHRLTIKCDEAVYSDYDVGDLLSSGELLRQSTIDGKGGG